VGNGLKMADENTYISSALLLYAPTMSIFPPLSSVRERRQNQVFFPLSCTSGQVSHDLLGLSLLCPGFHPSTWLALVDREENSYYHLPLTPRVSLPSSLQSAIQVSMLMVSSPR